MHGSPEHQKNTKDAHHGWRNIGQHAAQKLVGIIAREDVIAALTERALTVLDDAALRPEADAVLRELAAAATQRSV